MNQQEADQPSSSSVVSTLANGWRCPVVVLSGGRCCQPTQRLPTLCSRTTGSSWVCVPWRRHHVSAVDSGVGGAAGMVPMVLSMGGIATCGWAILRRRRYLRVLLLWARRRAERYLRGWRCLSGLLVLRRRWNGEGRRDGTIGGLRRAGPATT